MFVNCFFYLYIGSRTFRIHFIVLYFLLTPFIKNSYTIEAKVKSTGGQSRETFIFSVEKLGHGNCVLLRSSILKDTQWHYITITSSRSTFVDGVAVGAADISQNNGASCAGGTSSFSVANDQDGVGNVNDASQATGLYVNFVAVYDVAFTATETAARAALGCLSTYSPQNVWGLWYGDITSDRSGNGQINATMASADATVDATGGPYNFAFSSSPKSSSSDNFVCSKD